MLYIEDIFTSIQGEGYDSGKLTTFVRFYGCNLRCKYCDQVQDNKPKKRISVEKIIVEIFKRGVRNICITGGEPLLQKEVYSLIYELVHNDYNVSVETNGAIPIEFDSYDRSFKYVMDVKSPSSLMMSHNRLDNLANLQSKDEVKFVIADEVDYEYMREVLRKYPTKAKILVSPVFDKYDNPSLGKELVDLMIRDRLQDVKVQIQIHKVLDVK